MDPYLYYKNYDMKSDLHPRICTDDRDLISVSEEIYKFLIQYKFDTNEYLKKRQFYITAIRNYCTLYNIKLIETCWDSEISGVDINLGHISPWVVEGRHPDKEEHIMMAKLIIDQYKL
jgi:hypothetical protein